jgi:hypothetical protein
VLVHRCIISQGWKTEPFLLQTASAVSAQGGVLNK